MPQSDYKLNNKYEKYFLTWEFPNGYPFFLPACSHAGGGGDHQSAKGRNRILLFGLF